LRYLLQPHFYFTSTLNNAGPADGISNPQINGAWYERFIPWKIFPVTAEVARDSVAVRTRDFWLRQSDEESKDEEKQFVVNDQFPPLPIRQRLDPNTRDHYRGFIPKFDMLADFYDVMRNEWIAPLVNQGLVSSADLERWIKLIDQNGMPGISSFDPIDVLATTIWLASVLHAIEHISFADSTVANWAHFIAKHPATLGLHKEKPTPKGMACHCGRKLTAFRVLNGYNSICCACLCCCLSNEQQCHNYKSAVFFALFVDDRRACCCVAEELLSKKLYAGFQLLQDKKAKRKIAEIHEKYYEKLWGLREKWSWLVDTRHVSSSVAY